MQRLLTALLDFIFPPTPKEKVLRSINDGTHIKLNLGGVYKNIEYLGHYSEPILKVAITENKFNHHSRATKLLVDLFKLWLNKNEGEILFIPIPLGQNRKRERGYNQVEIILRQAGVKSINTSLLGRRFETTPQTQLHKSNRIKNMHDAFLYTGTDLDFSNFSKVVLFDDVVTTGATLLAARAELAPHLPPHVKLRCLAIAH